MKSRFLNRCRRAGSLKAIVGLALGVAFFASAFSADSQTNSSQHSKPLIKTSLGKAGMSDERLNRIGEMIEKAIDEKQIPGAVALVARNGKVVYHKAFGMANSQDPSLYIRSFRYMGARRKRVRSTISLAEYHT